MTSLCLLGVLALAPLCASAALECHEPLAKNEVRLRISVESVKNDKGNINVTLYPDDSKRWLAKGGKLGRQRVSARVPVSEACFQVPAASHYALVVYHDADDDKELNRSFLGLPAEGYGFSNNPKSLTGLPSLSEVRFAAHAGDNPVRIKLKY